MKLEQKREAGADLGLILTDFLNERRKRKLLGGSGARPNGKFFSILTSQSPLSWVSESFRQDNLASPSPRMKPCNFDLKPYNFHVQT